MTPPRRSLTVALAVTLSLASLGLGVGLAGHASVPKGIHKIQHVIVVMQENRSFDSYFGTYPGADGIPMPDGRPSVCVPDPRRDAIACDRSTIRTSWTSVDPTRIAVRSLDIARRPR